MNPWENCRAGNSWYEPEVAPERQKVYGTVTIGRLRQAVEEMRRNVKAPMFGRSVPEMLREWVEGPNSIYKRMEQFEPTAPLFLTPELEPFKPKLPQTDGSIRDIIEKMAAPLKNGAM